MIKNILYCWNLIIPLQRSWGGYTGFTLSICLFVRLSVRPSVSPSVHHRCPDVNLNYFHWILFFLYMHHLGEDLGWDRIWASYLIKYAHNGWSCDFGIFDIPEVNTSARAFKLYISRDLVWTNDISPGLCSISVFVFFPIFLPFSQWTRGCSVMSAWCPDDNLFKLVIIQRIQNGQLRHCP